MATASGSSASHGFLKQLRPGLPLIACGKGHGFAVALLSLCTSLVFLISFFHRQPAASRYTSRGLKHTGD